MSRKLAKLSGFFFSAYLSACGVPENTAVISYSGTAGVVYEAEVSRVFPIFVSSFLSNRYQELGRDLGTVLGEEIFVGEANVSSQVRATGSLARVISLAVEDRIIGSECQYFFQVDDPVLLRRIDGNIGFNFNTKLGLDRNYQAEIENYRQDLRQISVNIEILRNSISQSHNKKEIEELIEYMEMYSIRRAEYLDFLEEKVALERNKIAPGEHIISVVNRCRDLSAGDRVYLITYRSGIVVEPVSSD